MNRRSRRYTSHGKNELKLMKEATRWRRSSSTIKGGSRPEFGASSLMRRVVTRLRGGVSLPERRKKMGGSG